MQLGKIKKDYYKAFSQEEICTKEYKQDDNDDNDEGVAIEYLLLGLHLSTGFMYIFPYSQ